MSGLFIPCLPRSTGERPAASPPAGGLGEGAVDGDLVEDEADAIVGMQRDPGVWDPGLPRRRPTAGPRRRTWARSSPCLDRPAGVRRGESADQRRCRDLACTGHVGSGQYAPGGGALPDQGPRPPRKASCTAPPVAPGTRPVALAERRLGSRRRRGHRPDRACHRGGGFPPRPRRRQRSVRAEAAPRSDLHGPRRGRGLQRAGRPWPPASGAPIW